MGVASRDFLSAKRGNGIRNIAASGAVAGTPGTLPTNWASFVSPGMTQQIVSVGQDGGFPYIDWRVFGTATGTSGSALRFEAVNGVPAAAGESWVHCCYVALAGGSVSGLTGRRIGIVTRDAGGASTGNFISSNLVFSDGGVFFIKKELKVLTTGATTAFVQPFVEIIYNNAAVVDITLRVSPAFLSKFVFS